MSEDKKPEERTGRKDLLAEVERLSYIVDSIPDGIWREMILFEKHVNPDGFLEIYQMDYPGRYYEE